MDSVTQFVLGAAVGDVVAGRKAGNKAMLWGAVGGTIPDLDVFLNLIYPEPQSLLMHRGFSHSVFFAFLAAPVLGYLLHRYDKSLERNDWIKLFFWSIITHPFLDIFTGYGTGLFVPLWDYRIQFDTIFIVDPLYTLPLLISFLWLLVKSKPFELRLKKSRLALVLSTSYLLITVVVKLVMLGRVNSEIDRQSIVAEKVMVAPAAFNTFLWSVIVKEKDHYKVGYASLLDSKTEINFEVKYSNHHLLKNIGRHDEVAVLTKFSKGYFVLNQDEGTFIWNDLRFGTTRGWFDEQGEYIFSFRLEPEGGNLSVERIPPERGISARDFDMLFERTIGN